MNRRWIRVAGAGLVLTAHVHAADPTSNCYGTPERGRLEHGVALPARGANFQA